LITLSLEKESIVLGKILELWIQKSVQTLNESIMESLAPCSPRKNLFYRTASNQKELFAKKGHLIPPLFPLGTLFLDVLKLLA